MGARDTIDRLIEATNGSVWLNKTLNTRGDYDPYRYDYLIRKWAEDELETKYIDGTADPNDYESAMEAESYDELPQYLQSEFRDWLNDNMHNLVADGDIAPLDQDPRDYFGTPAHIKPNTWLIHFSNYAEYIWKEGFKHGADYDYMHLTKHMSEPGSGEWAFAFVADEVPNIGFKYGTSAVMFKSSSAIVAWHSGDDEPQVIFNREEAPVRDRVLISNYDGDWYVGDETRPLFRGDLDNVIKWVMANYDQYKKKLVHS